MPNQQYSTSNDTLDPQLIKHGDKRNVIDRYRRWTVEAISHDLRQSASKLEIAVENLERDFNMRTIIRSANAFNVRRVHIIGRRQWNKRGAMMTDKYLELVYHSTVANFVQAVSPEYQLIALDNQPGAQDLASFPLIEQFGSTRSLNVGVASGIAMYEWTRRFRLS